MDLPIQFRFYRKLELYQELKHLNKSAKENGIFERNWKVAKALLRRAARNQHELVYTRSFTELLDVTFPALEDAQISDNEREIDITQTVIEDLIRRKYIEGDQSKVKFTKEGVLMGEVIDDCESILKRWQYWILYYFTWLMFLFGGMFVIVKGVKAVIDLYFLFLI